MCLQYCFATCVRAMHLLKIVYLSFSNHELEISHEQKMHYDWLIFTKLHCKLPLTCHMQQLVKKLRIVLISLQLAMQHFVTLHVAKMGCYM